MEGRLRPNHHFALINYENMGEVIEHFLAHPDEARQIVENANNYVKQFLDLKKEFQLSILVLAKYFYYSGQCDLAGQNELLALIK